jgi:hypothetical protein
MPSGRREQITESRERAAIDLIDNWDPAKARLSRQALARAVQERLGFKVTRQGLMKRAKIREAYSRREKDLQTGRTSRAQREPLAAILERRIAELEDLVRDKEVTISSYKELFVTYRYNARQLGISAEKLEAQIPSRGIVQD